MPRNGFTIIELTVAVVIVAILAAIAYPTYAAHIRKGKRAAAQAALVDLASRQQTYLLERRAYLACATDACLSALGWIKPAEIAGDYTFSVTTSSNGTTFVGTGTPSAALRAQGEQVVSITHTGQKLPASTPGYWGH